jgi:hypothetical protein
MTTSRFGRSPDRTIRQTIGGATAHLGTHSVVHEDDEEER